MQRRCGDTPQRVPGNDLWTWSEASGARDQSAVSPCQVAISRSRGAGSPRKRWAPPPGGDGAHTRGDLLLRQRHVSGDLAQ